MIPFSHGEDDAGNEAETLRPIREQMVKPHAAWAAWPAPSTPGDIIADTARGLLRIEHRVFGPSLWAWRFWIVSIGISVFLTTVTVLMSDFMWFRDIRYAVTFYAQRPLLSIYLLNGVFNIAGFLLTIGILTIVLRVSRYWHLPLLFLDAGGALLVSILCWVAAMVVAFPQTSPVSLMPPGFDFAKLGRHLALYIGYMQYIGLIGADTVKMWAEATGGWISPVRIMGGRLADWGLCNINMLPTAVVVTVMMLLSASHLLFCILRRLGFTAGERRPYRH